MIFRISYFLVLAVILRLSRALTGDYVCQKVENYTETSQEVFMQPVVVHTFTWCFQIPPRCPKTRKEMHPRYRTKTEVKQRTVNECCEGYTIEEVHGENDTEAKCVPFCEKCVEGECTSPNNCLCNPGYQGGDCSYECQPGSWGKYCMQECNCTRESACNPVNGRCECPPGWQGIRCEDKCPPGRWGLYCGFSCNCSDQLSGCHHETGECFDLEVSFEVSFDPVPTIKEWTLSELTPSSGATTDVSSPPYSEQENNTDFIDVTNADDFGDSNLDDLQIIRISTTTEEVENASLKASLTSTESQATMHISSSTEKYSYEATRPSGSTTYQTLQVPIPTENVPKKNQISTTNTGQMHIFGDENFNSHGKPSFGSTDEFELDPQVVMSPKTDYVKNVRRESSTTSPLPMDIAALVIIGSIISLGLTSAAALMIFHMRAKLFEAVRLSIFNEEKVNCSGIEKGNVERISTINTSTLPRTLTRSNPVCNATPEPKAILTLDETGNEYANGTVTIGIRLSSNLRELLESQYDRPTSFCHRGASQTEMEHVYDEIPLSSPFCITKDT